jgi:formyltetrahydrofolate deformylase
VTEPVVPDTWCLTVTCPDRPGTVAAISALIAGVEGNITGSSQFSDAAEHGTFFARMEFHLEDPDPARVQALRDAMVSAAAEREMRWGLSLMSARKRVALFVSREEHCLLDLLWRIRAGDLHLEVVAVVSNHPDLREEVERFDVPYVHIPVTRETKPQAEARQLELLAGRVDFVVLARYMQILSADFLAGIGCPVINIHHSFLPAFIGAEPYVQAHRRGVKLIGATAHYATEDLDEGPIIEQEVSRVGHRHDARALAYIGRDLERIVLARAVNWHLQDRVIVHGNRTVVFT